jgi:tetratricopeptide (TPR) repeat protein
MNELCSEEEMQSLVETIQSDDRSDLAHVDQMLRSYPDDPRLHFLRGSILAGIGRHIEALPALMRAVELAPDFAIARFQLGFFQLTSNEAANALGTWGPLALLPEDHYLRIFVGGLTHLIRDEFAEADARLREGIAANGENLPLNRDMQLILDNIQPLLTNPAKRSGDETTSAASFLLDQLSGGKSVH